MAKYFIFMYIEDEFLRDHLNLAIYLLNPQERWPAHVTIAGPFDRPLEIPRSLKFMQQISILGRGRFDNESRQTVFLHVGSRDMRARILKPDFPNAIPHLTLYSGRDKELADLLYDRLERTGLYGLFHSERLEVVESRQQFSFNFKFQIKPDILPPTAGKTLDDLKKLSKKRRVELAVVAIRIGFLGSLRKQANPLLKQLG